MLEARSKVLLLSAVSYDSAMFRKSNYLQLCTSSTRAVCCVLWAINCCTNYVTPFFTVQLSCIHKLHYTLVCSAEMLKCTGTASIAGTMDARQIHDDHERILQDIPVDLLLIELVRAQDQAHQEEEVLYPI